MDELLKTFRNFLFRDFFYIVCGVIIIRASREVGSLQIQPLSGNGTMDAVVFAGISYAIGYLNQEIWSQTPFVTTARLDKYNGFLRALFKNHTRQPWSEIAASPDRRHLAARSDEAYNRILNHKIVGAAMGSALLTSSILLAIPGIFEDKMRLLGLAAGLLALGAAFVLVAWVKTMQQCKYLADLPEEEPASRPGTYSFSVTGAAGGRSGEGGIG